MLQCHFIDAKDVCRDQKSLARSRASSELTTTAPGPARGPDPDQTGSPARAQKKQVFHGHRNSFRTWPRAGSP